MVRNPWTLGQWFGSLICLVVATSIISAEDDSGCDCFNGLGSGSEEKARSGTGSGGPSKKRSLAGGDDKRTNWQRYRGRAGPSRWRAHVVEPDPQNHGPDGINLYDWDGDGALDLFVNYEEGAYSRLYFNPGADKLRKEWAEFVEFQHGPCEDSGSGDLDNDGDIDYIANGGWVYFNPGSSDVREQEKWTSMTLFDYEQRVPTVADVDGDGLNDLIVDAQSWYQQPVNGKHDAKNWKQHVIGRAIWPMSCLVYDVDKDGDRDLVVADRKKEVFWYINGGKNKVTGRWARKQIHPHTSMFMTICDINRDGTDDFVIAGGGEGNLKYRHHLIVLLRTNQSGHPTFKEILIPQPCGERPKGVAAINTDGDPTTNEIIVTPEFGELWKATYTGDPMEVKNWTAEAIEIPGAETRLKLDNVYPGDLDGDGDLDIVTTEENGGWGVVWFENPEKQKSKK